MTLTQTKKAANILKQGGIVIFPTDTAFGMGCRIDAESAIKRLFEIRKRPTNKAVPVLVSSIEMAQKYLLPLTAKVKQLMDTYWPGGLTIVYRCLLESVPALVRGGGTTLGVRMPDQTDTLKLIDAAGAPILGPSANFHGEPTPFTFSDLNPRLLELVDYVVSGHCKGKQASTVIDCSHKKWRVVRQGSVQININVS